jgi:hypothetical protein
MKYGAFGMTGRRAFAASHIILVSNEAICTTMYDPSSV